MGTKSKEKRKETKTNMKIARKRKGNRTSEQTNRNKK